jgi:hypothetical protein
MASIQLASRLFWDVTMRFVNRKSLVELRALH